MEQIEVGPRLEVILNRYVDWGIEQCSSTAATVAFCNSMGHMLAGGQALQRLETKVEENLKGRLGEIKHILAGCRTRGQFDISIVEVEKIIERIEHA